MTTRATNTKKSLTLELQTPQLRAEAFPWGPTDIDVQAIVSAHQAPAFRRVVRPPAVIDLGALLLEGEAPEGRLGAADSLDVEVVGYDNGVAFILGTTPIRLPSGSVLLQTGVTSDYPFRTALTGVAGLRAGTLVGTFRAFDMPVVDAAGIDEVAEDCGRLPGPGSAAVETKAAGKYLLLAAEQANKLHCHGLEDKAIELLEAASNILASPRSCVGQQCMQHPSGGSSASMPTAACERAKEEDSEGMPRDRKIGSEAPPDVTAALGDSSVYACNLTSDFSPRFDKAGVDDGDMRHAPRFPTAGFKFQPTTGSVDLHRIASCNISKILREGDLQTLKQFLPEVAVGMVEEEDFDAHPGLVKAFRLAQLQTQYVLHCSQVLQRQCDGLQAALNSMELETNGNTEGTRALKNRAHLLRKERRKQDKIISGYAALLRAHNPGLASKVFLDEKCRLRIVGAPKLSRHAGPRVGRTRRHTRGRRRPDDTTEYEQLNNTVHENSTDGSRSPFGSAISSEGGVSGGSGGSSMRSGAASTPESHAARAPATTGGEAQRPPPVAEAGRGGGSDAVAAFGGLPARRQEGGIEQVWLASGEEIESDSPVWTDSERQERGGVGENEAPAIRSTRGGAGAEARAGASGNRAREAAAPKLTAADARRLVDDGWAREGSDYDSDDGDDGGDTIDGDNGSCGGDKNASSILPRFQERSTCREEQGGRVDRSRHGEIQGEAAITAGDRYSPDSTGPPARPLLVSVKPKTGGEQQGRHQQHQQHQHQQHQHDQLRRETVKATNNAISSAVSYPRGGGGSNSSDSGAPPTPPIGPTSVSRQDKKGGVTTAAKRAAIAKDGRGGPPPQPRGVGDIVTEDAGLSRGGAADGGGAAESRGDVRHSFVADAARLGLEGDEFPDVSEFDLDYISEIDAGGEEWAGNEEEGGSVSS